MKSEHLRMEFVSQERSAPLPSLLAAACAALILAWVAFLLTGLLSERATQQQALHDIRDKSRSEKSPIMIADKPDPKISPGLLSHAKPSGTSTPPGPTCWTGLKRHRTTWRCWL